MIAIKEISFNDSPLSITVYEDHVGAEYFKPIEFMKEKQLKKWQFSVCFNTIQTMIDNDCENPRDFHIIFDGEDYFYTEFLPYALIYVNPRVTYEFLDLLSKHFTDDISESSSEDSGNIIPIEDDSSSEIEENEAMVKLENRIDRLEDLIANLAKDIKSLKPRRR